MTTLLLDLKNKKLYTDSRVTSSNYSGLIKKKKKESFEDNFVKFYPSKKYMRMYTGTGCVRDIEKVIKTIEAGRQPKIKSKTSVWQIDNYPSFKVVSYGNSETYAVENVDFLCNGSGGEFAAGAVKAGSTPMEAMDIAIELDRYSGGEIKCYDVSGAPDYDDNN